MKKLPVPVRVLLHALNVEAFCAVIFYSAGAGRYLPEDELSGLLLAFSVLLHVAGLILSSVVALPLSMLFAEYVTWWWKVNVAVCHRAFVGWAINASRARGADRRTLTVQ